MKNLIARPKHIELNNWWYKELIQDLKKLEFTGIVLTKHAIGCRILQDELKFGKPEYGSKRVENLAKDLNVATREIWRCVQFAKKCHTVTQLEHKSWRYVINNFLPDNHRPKEDNKLEQVKGQYEVIVIDPPWPYGTEYDSQTRRVASPYKEVSFEELKNFNIPASENSVLWLWTTHKFLPISFDLLRDWGFEYKLTLVWNKEKLGMGAWLRCQAEFCLLGIKGKPEWDLVNERDIINSKRREHSRKPNEFYNMVEKLSSGRKIDIFGREKRDGWDSYGNEEKF